MREKLNNQKKEMAFIGYYTVSDYAPLKGVSKQLVSREYKKYEYVEYKNRRWFKFDNGERAVNLYGTNFGKELSLFEQFGFKKRMKSLAVCDNAIVDVKRLREGEITVRFYNAVGDMLCLYLPIKAVEIIKNDGND